MTELLLCTIAAHRFPKLDSPPLLYRSMTCTSSSTQFYLMPSLMINKLLIILPAASSKPYPPSLSGALANANNLIKCILSKWMAHLPLALAMPLFSSLPGNTISSAMVPIAPATAAMVLLALPWFFILLPLPIPPVLPLCSYHCPSSQNLWQQCPRCLCPLSTS